MLNRELNHFSESSRAGSQVSDYIFSTFMGERKYAYVIFTEQNFVKDVVKLNKLPGTGADLHYWSLPNLTQQFNIKIHQSILWPDSNLRSLLPGGQNAKPSICRPLHC